MGERIIKKWRKKRAIDREVDKELKREKAQGTDERQRGAEGRQGQNGRGGNRRERDRKPWKSISKGHLH